MCILPSSLLFVMSADRVIDHFHLTTIKSNLAPGVLLTSSRVKSECAAFNKVFQSSSSRSWELDVAIMVMSESLFLSAILAQKGLAIISIAYNTYLFHLSARRGSVQGASRHLSLNKRRAPGFRAGISALRILRQYLSDQS
jgi:hypothetical protein